MDDAALRSLLKRLEVLERTSVRARLGEVTDDSPLTVTIGGADTEIASAPRLADTPLAAGDPVAALTYGAGLLVIGRVGDPPAWAAYTATVTDTSVTLGTGGTSIARYVKHGRLAHCRGEIVLGAGGAFTGTEIRVALPVAASATGTQVGQLAAYDSSTGLTYAGACLVDGGSTFYSRFGNAANAALAATSPFTWAASDVLRWQLTYETAA